MYIFFPVFVLSLSSIFCCLSGCVFVDESNRFDLVCECACEYFVYIFVISVLLVLYIESFAIFVFILIGYVVA